MSAPTARKTPLATYVAARHADSRKAVAAGAHPLERSATPGAIRHNGQAVIVTVEGKKLVAHSEGASAETLNPILASALVQRCIGDSGDQTAPGLVFESKAALGRFLAAVRVDNRRLADATRHVSRLTVGSRVVVLPDALAAKYWAPTPVCDTDGWIAAFKADKLDRLAGLRHLYWLATGADGVSAESSRLLARMVGIETSIWSRLRRNIPSANMEAFRDSQTHREMFSAVTWADPVMRPMHLLTGEVVEVKPRRLIGGMVEAFVSTPFKLKEGEVVLYDETGNQGSASIVTLGYDSGLTATFQTSERAGRNKAKDGTPSSTAAAHGHRVLMSAHDKGATVWASRKPFVPSGRGAQPGESVWVHGNLGEKPQRSLPLFVTVNGMAASGYNGTTGRLSGTAA